MTADCFALLDDAGTPGAASRLYTGHAATLVCRDGAGWPQLLGEMERHLRQGRHAVALCAYELGIHLQGLPASAAATGEALARVLVFEQCRRLSQAQVAAWLAERAARDASSAGAPGALDALAAGVANIHADVGEREFCAALARIHDYIEAGDAYQVNYTYRLRFDAYGSPAALYARLRARQPVPYGALVGLPDGGAVLSLSPE
ncbi:MAG: chorismate-binding protein, partial [Burkholderiaceae bacterium]|nr:chorismate-binding protein [Burkholderiaceae bacterium]